MKLIFWGYTFIKYWMNFRKHFVKFKSLTDAVRFKSLTDTVNVLFVF